MAKEQQSLDHGSSKLSEVLPASREDIQRLAAKERAAPGLYEQIRSAVEHLTKRTQIFLTEEQKSLLAEELLLADYPYELIVGGCYAITNGAVKTYNKLTMETMREGIKKATELVGQNNRAYREGFERGYHVGWRRAFEHMESIDG